MDHKTSDSLDPKLRETYDRIMGNTNAPLPGGSTVPNLKEQQSTQVPPTEHIPQAIGALLSNPQTPPIQHTAHVSALNPPVPHTSIGGAIGEPKIIKEKRFNHLLLKIIIVLTILCVGGYILFWLQLFKFVSPI